MPMFDSNNHAAGEIRLTPALGLVMDTVDYGRRSTRHQQDVQERLAAIMEKVLADIGVRAEELQFSGMSGDGLSMFLPAAIDPTRALPRLFMATATRLVDDNHRYRDQIRIRMAAGFGLVGQGPLGFVGHLMVEISRLNDSQPARRALVDHPECNLVVLISHMLYQLVDQFTHPPNDLLALERVEVAMKEYSAPAWMWIVTNSVHS